MKLAVRSAMATIFAASALPALPLPSPVPAPVVFHVSLGQASATPVSGRLLIFAKLLGPTDTRPVARVDMDQIDTHATAIAAAEVARLALGATVDLDADVSAYPTPFSQLKPGRYAVQAVLDLDHSYKRDLDGKVHLTVGSADTFYLDGSAHRLEETMMGLGAKTDFCYVEGRGHFDLYQVGDEPWGLYQAIAWEMYAHARPGSKPASTPARICLPKKRT